MQKKIFLVFCMLLSFVAKAEFKISRDEKAITDLKDTHYFWYFTFGNKDNWIDNSTCDNGKNLAKCNEFYKNGFPVAEGVTCKVSLVRDFSTQTDNNKVVRVNKFENASVKCTVDGIVVNLSGTYCAETVSPSIKDEEVGDGNQLNFEKAGIKRGIFELNCRRKWKGDL